MIPSGMLISNDKKFSTKMCGALSMNGCQGLQLLTYSVEEKSNARQ